MAEDDDMPPPLEDMEEELALLGKLRDMAQGKQQHQPQEQRSQPVTRSPRETTASKTQASKDSKAEEQSSSNGSSNGSSTAKKGGGSKRASSAKKSSSGGGGGFGGFQKGFLSGGFGGGSSDKSKAKGSKSSKSSKSGGGGSGGKTRHTKSATPSIETVRPKQPNAQPGVLPDVQQSMQDAMPFLEKTKDKWLNADLLKRFQESPFLTECLADPTFAAAIGEFQKDPAAAKEKYAGNEKMLRFFQEYFRVMGAHFMDLGDKEEKEKQAHGKGEQAPKSSAKQNTKRTGKPAQSTSTGKASSSGPRIELLD